MRPPEHVDPAGQAPFVRRREPIFDAPRVVIALAILLLAIHGGMSALPDAWQDVVARQFAFIPGRLTIAIWPNELQLLLARANENQEALRQAVILRHFHVIEDGSKIWTLLTYAFLHGGWTHVGLNVVWLIAFGPPVARRIGALRFLVLFAATAIAGALVHWAFNPLDFTPLIGASAGDSGLMAAATRFVFQPGAPLGGSAYSSSAPRADDFAPAPPLRILLSERRALTFLVVWFIANFIFGAGAQTLGLSDGPVAWLAHIGGFALGFFTFPLFDRPRGRAPSPLS
jgi:membrane associated rhomboid family serine protease